VSDDSIKMDLHMHSHYSEDATGTARDIIKVAKKKGLKGISITDHNSTMGSIEAMKLKTEGLLIIPGQEISTADGHILAFGITEKIDRDLPVVETVERIIDAGGVPVVPHLFRAMSGIKKKNLERIANKIPAMEVFNGFSLPKTNIKTSRVAKEFNLGGTGGSDGHAPSHVGYGYTTFQISDLSVDAILDEIEKKRTWGYGTTIPLEIRKKRMLKSIRQFFERGFKRI